MEHYKLRENDITELSEFWVSRSDNPFLCLPSGVIQTWQAGNSII